jgi:hypothetical protein
MEGVENHYNKYKEFHLHMEMSGMLNMEGCFV